MHQDGNIRDLPVYQIGRPFNHAHFRTKTRAGKAIIKDMLYAVQSVPCLVPEVSWDRLHDSCDSVQDKQYKK